MENLLTFCKLKITVSEKFFNRFQSLFGFTRRKRETSAFNRSSSGNSGILFENISNQSKQRVKFSGFYQTERKICQ